VQSKRLDEHPLAEDASRRLVQARQGSQGGTRPPGTWCERTARLTRTTVGQRTPSANSSSACPRHHSCHRWPPRCRWSGRLLGFGTSSLEWPLADSSLVTRGGRARRRHDRRAAVERRRARRRERRREHHRCGLDSPMAVLPAHRGSVVTKLGDAHDIATTRCLLLASSTGAALILAGCRASRARSEAEARGEVHGVASGGRRGRRGRGESRLRGLGPTTAPPDIFIDGGRLLDRAWLEGAWEPGRTARSRPARVGRKLAT
jgi:hypothetical protein